MSYAIRKDGLGWRAINSPDEVAVDETFSVDEPALTQTPDQIVEKYESALQGALDAGAKSWGYDDIKTAVGYVGDPFPRFNAEALALRKWRSDVWVWAGMEEAAIKAGNKTLPTPVEAFLAQMPPMPSRP